MKSCKDYYEYLDHRTLKLLMAKATPEKEFLKTYGSEEMYNDLQKAKVGYIKVQKISDNPGIETGKVYEGITGAFGENIAVWISNPSTWFHTSTIKSIDWDKKRFKTENSTYAFEFEEINFDELITKLMDSETDSLARHFLNEYKD